MPENDLERYAESLDAVAPIADYLAFLAAGTPDAERIAGEATVLRAWAALCRTAAAAQAEPAADEPVPEGTAAPDVVPAPEPEA